MTSDNEKDLIVTQHDYDEWLKRKGELDPEDQRYTWPGPKFPVIYKVLVVLLILLAMIVLEVVAIGRMGR